MKHSVAPFSGARRPIFDFDPSGRSDFGCVRLVVQGEAVSAPCSFDDDRYHHLAATCDDGEVRVYLDGKELFRRKLPGGPIALLTNLRVGEDSGPFTNNSKGPTTDEQLKGYVDYLLVLGRALSGTDIRFIATEGAARYFSGKSTDWQYE